MKDVCLNCGKEHEEKLWGAKCNCEKPNVVHQQKCDGCGRIIGIIMDDDYVGTSKLYCPDCVEKYKDKKQQLIEKKYFLVKQVNCGCTGVNPIRGFTDNEEYAKSMQGVFCDYEEIKFLDISQWRKEKVKEIAQNYHERDICATLSMLGQKCQCCEQIVLTTKSIEHDSQDHSKDLNICTDCYVEIVNYWKDHKPGKICPTETI